jgi:signal transduction histidine kinase/iron only hydrogenase large subunit-like protein
MRGIVETIPDLCKRCYSCVRECPAIAIKVENEQAVVLTERCISCGHCVTVCSQHAKKTLSDKDKVLKEILLNGKTIAIVAPSFSASFPDNYLKVPTALKKLGFDLVCETAFGADLISNHYLKEIQENPNKVLISSPCPAVFNFIEKYRDRLVPNLAKIVSPMIAMGRYLRANLGNDIKIVFIGPCIAKKSEYRDEEVEGTIDAVLTFGEIKEIFKEKNIDVNKLEDSFFDPPYANMGKSYPLAGGLLKTADIPGDILEKKVIVVEGPDKFLEIIDELNENKINARFIDILFCDGCIQGPGIDSNLNHYARREKVIDYIENNINKTDKGIWKSNIYNSRDLDLSREFTYKNQLRPLPTEERIKEILAETGKFTKQDELNCGACGYNTCRNYALAIAQGLAENDMCLPYLIQKLEIAYKDLKDTQVQLQHAEKLASIGQLAAGVAHEINNPLGTILMYTSLVKKQLADIQEKAQAVDDLELIAEETNRCKNIVSNLLNFARQGKLNLSNLDVFDLINDILKSLKVRPEFKGISLSVENNTDDSLISGDEDQLKQVFLNIITNACESLEESEIKKVMIRMKRDNSNIVVEIEDTGCGIPEENFNKLYTPFFTTKKMGKGTGLGLAIAYGIIKMHKGDIRVRSTKGKGTTFIIKLPFKI